MTLSYIEGWHAIAEARALWQRNLVTLAMLKRNLPALKTDSDQHYADILTSLYKKRLREMHEEKTAGRQGGGEPCLNCGRSPGHAHHLRFAQPRALGRKVSDEWVVPLCATHHRALHGVGDEERWWKERGIDPIGHAQILWWTTRVGNAPQASENPAGMNKDREKEFASMPQ